MHLVSEKPVHKQRPAFDILNLIKKNVLKRAIYLIQHLQHIIQLRSIKTVKTLIVKIRISELDASASQSLHTQR